MKNINSANLKMGTITYQNKEGGGNYLFVYIEFSKHEAGSH
jgi:hypothetical protein